MRALLLVVLLAGCAPLDGYPCETLDEQRCDGADVAFCEATNLGGKKWKTYDCPRGCDSLATEKCDWRGVVNATECPPSKNGASACTGDGELTTCYISTLGGAKWTTTTCTRCVKDRPPAEVLRREGDFLVCD